MNNNLPNDEIIASVNVRLDELSSIEPIDDILTEAIRYSLLSPGKRVRSLLTFAAGVIGNASFKPLLDIAAAIELIHCYSLIHDDLPPMDNDELRRGRPTCHKQYGEAIAILAGDALQSLAFTVLSDEHLNIDAKIKLKIIQLIANSIGVCGMAGGQALDILNTDKPLRLEQLQQMHAKKTGALIKAAIISGYLAGDAYDDKTYHKLNLAADNIGLLFQITDDILDITVSTEALGKTAAKDAADNKATYVNILGLQEAKELAGQLFHTTLQDLQQLDNSKKLLELTTFIYKRDK